MLIRASRGRPVMALAVMLCGWVAARAMILNDDSGVIASTDRVATVPQRLSLLPVPTERATVATRLGGVAVPAGTTAASDPAIVALAPLTALRNAELPQAWAPPLPHGPAPIIPVRSETPMMPSRMSVGVAAGHQMLWLAALAQLPLPSSIMVAAPAQGPRPAHAPTSGASRWSADGWFLLRRGGSLLAAGPLPASYGASQLGAVLRYRLDPASPDRPTAYLRASAALGNVQDKELAIGLAARPLGRLPIVAAVELRASQGTGTTRLRPAALLVSEFPSLPLPLGLRGEAYAQAGYVGGSGASAFVDGQLRVDRRVLRLGRSELRAGGGIWGGAQRGASRLDVGPGATIGLLLGPAAARLGFDWRFRIAGNAAPASGPALTLSAGF